MFSVGVTRRFLDDHFLPSLVPSTIREKMLPRKVNIFLWRLILDRLPHRLNLSSRGMEIQEILCPSCHGSVESNQHIFFACSIARSIWQLVRRWCDISMPQFDSIDDWREWLSSWSTSLAKKQRIFVNSVASLWVI